MTFTHCAPELPVGDVGASITFYAEVLGFEVDYKSGEPPSYAVVVRDEVYIHLCSPHSLRHPGSVLLSSVYPASMNCGTLYV